MSRIINPATGRTFGEPSAPSTSAAHRPSPLPLRLNADGQRLVARALRRQLWNGELVNQNDYRFARRHGRMPNHRQRRELRELELLEMPTRAQAEANAVRLLTAA